MLLLRECRLSACTPRLHSKGACSPWGTQKGQPAAYPALLSHSTASWCWRLCSKNNKGFRFRVQDHQAYPQCAGTPASGFSWCARSGSAPAQSTLCRVSSKEQGSGLRAHPRCAGTPASGPSRCARSGGMPAQSRRRAARPAGARCCPRCPPPAAPYTHQTRFVCSSSCCNQLSNGSFLLRTRRHMRVFD